jgi:hypothetical protein
MCDRYILSRVGVGASVTENVGKAATIFQSYSAVDAPVLSERGMNAGMVFPEFFVRRWHILASVCYLRIVIASTFSLLIFTYIIAISSIQSSISSVLVPNSCMQSRLLL